MFLHRFFIELVCFPFDDQDRILRAFTKAGPKPVAQVVRSETRLAVGNGDRPLGAGVDSDSASVAFFLVDFNDFSDPDKIPFDSNSFASDIFLKRSSARDNPVSP